MSRSNSFSALKKGPANEKSRRKASVSSVYDVYAHDQPYFIGWLRYSSLQEEERRNVYDSITSVCRSKALWNSARWYATYAVRTMDEVDVRQTLAYFQSKKPNPAVDDEILDMIRDLSNLQPSSHQTNRHDVCNILEYLRRQVSEKYLMDNDETSSAKQSKDKDKDSNRIHSNIGGQHAELAMLWSTLNNLIAIDDGDSVTPITLFFQDFLQELVQYPFLSLSAVWSHISYPNCHVSMVGDVNSEKDDSLLKQTAEEELQRLMLTAATNQDILPSISTISRCHDPLSVIQNLFNLSESQIMFCLLEQDVPGPLLTLLEVLSALLLSCLVLAVKSGRESLMLRAISLMKIASISLKEMSKAGHASDLSDLSFPSNDFDVLRGDMLQAARKDPTTSSDCSAESHSLSHILAYKGYNSKALDNLIEGRRNQGGVVLTCGKAEHGKLGHGDTQQHRLIPTVIEALEFGNITKVASMSTYTLALDETGSVYIWGSGGSVGSLNSSRRDIIPKLLDALPFPKSRVADISCGLGHSLFLTDTGSVFSWGNGANGRLGLGDIADHTEACWVAALGDEVISAIQCGASHSMALTSSGSVYCWGKNTQGQCGLGHTEDVLRPKLVRSLPFNYHPTIQLAAGWEHSLALTKTGKVFAWGCGYKDNRRTVVPPVLGLGHNESRHSPHEIMSLEGVFVTHVACGWDHCLALDKNGKVLSWGSGQNGKLGHGTDENFSVPCYIAALDGVVMEFIGAGCEHSAAISSDGKLYTWGHGDGGRLGHGDNLPCLIPTKVSSMETMTLRPFSVYCGDKFTAVLAKFSHKPQTSDSKLWNKSSQGVLTENVEATEANLERRTDDRINVDQCAHIALRVMKDCLASHSLLDGESRWSQGPLSGLPAAFDSPFAKELNPNTINLLAFLLQLHHNQFMDMVLKSQDPNSAFSEEDKTSFNQIESSLSDVIELLDASISSLSSYHQCVVASLKSKSSKSPVISSKDRRSSLSKNKIKHHRRKSSILPSQYDNDDNLSEQDDDDDADYMIDDEYDRSLIDNASSAYNSPRSLGEHAPDSAMSSANVSGYHSDFLANSSKLDHTMDTRDDRASPAPSYESVSLDQSAMSDELVTAFDMLAVKGVSMKKDHHILSNMSVPQQYSDDHEDQSLQRALLMSVTGIESMNHDLTKHHSNLLSRDSLLRRYKTAMESGSSAYRRLVHDLCQQLDQLSSQCFEILSSKPSDSYGVASAERIWLRLQSVHASSYHFLRSIDDKRRKFIDLTTQPHSNRFIVPGVVSGILQAVEDVPALVRDIADGSVTCFYSKYPKKLSSSHSKDAMIVSMQDVIALIQYVSQSTATRRLSAIEQLIRRNFIKLAEIWLSIAFCSRFYLSDTSTASTMKTDHLSRLLGACVEAVRRDFDSFEQIVDQVESFIPQYLETTLSSCVLQLISQMMVSRVKCMESMLMHQINDLQLSNGSTLPYQHDSYDILIAQHVFALCDMFHRHLKSTISSCAPLNQWMESHFRGLFRYVADLSDILCRPDYRGSIALSMDILRLSKEYKSKTHNDETLSRDSQRWSDVIARDNDIVKILTQRGVIAQLEVNQWPDCDLSAGNASSVHLSLSCSSLSIEMIETFHLCRFSSMSDIDLFNILRLNLWQPSLDDKSYGEISQSDLIYWLDVYMIALIAVDELVRDARDNGSGSVCNMVANHVYNLIISLDVDRPNDDGSSSLRSLLVSLRPDSAQTMLSIDTLDILQQITAIRRHLSANKASCGHDFLNSNSMLSAEEAIHTHLYEQCDRNSQTSRIEAIVRLMIVQSKSYRSVHILAGYEASSCMEWFAQGSVATLEYLAASKHPDRSLSFPELYSLPSPLPLSITESKDIIRYFYRKTHSISQKDALQGNTALDGPIDSVLVPQTKEPSHANEEYLMNVIDIQRYHRHLMSSYRDPISHGCNHPSIDDSLVRSVSDLIGKACDWFRDRQPTEGSQEDRHKILSVIEKCSDLMVRFDLSHISRTAASRSMAVRVVSCLQCLASQLQNMFQSVAMKYQSYLDLLIGNNGQALFVKPMNISTACSSITANVSSALSDYTIGFWLKIPSQYVKEVSKEIFRKCSSCLNEESKASETSKTSSSPAKRDGPCGCNKEAIKRLHILSRIPETADFNMLSLFEYKFPSHCNPSIFLCFDCSNISTSTVERVARVYLSIFVTVPSKPTNNAGGKTIPAKRIHIQSSDLSCDRWIHCAVSFNQDKEKEKVSSTDIATNDANYIQMVDKKPSQKTIKFVDVLKAKLYIDNVFDQGTETTSSERRHSLHQNIVFGSIPIIIDRCDDNETSDIMISDPYWIPTRDILVDYSPVNGSKGQDGVPPHDDLILMQKLQNSIRQTIIAYNKCLEYTQDMMTAEQYQSSIEWFGYLLCRVVLTGSCESQTIQFHLLRRLSSQISREIFQRWMRILMIPLSQLYCLINGMEWLDSSFLDPIRCDDKEPKKSDPFSLTEALIINMNRFKNIHSVSMIHKQNAIANMAGSSCHSNPLLSIDENILLRGISSLFRQISSNHRESIIPSHNSDDLDHILASFPVNHRVLSFFLDVCRGGWFPFAEYGDSVLIPSRGLNSMISSPFLPGEVVLFDKNVHNLQEMSLFRSVGQVYHVNQVKTGLWIADCDGFYYGQQIQARNNEDMSPCDTNLLYPRHHGFVLTSEMIFVRDMSTLPTNSTFVTELQEIYSHKKDVSIPSSSWIEASQLSSFLKSLIFPRDKSSMAAAPSAISPSINQSKPRGSSRESGGISQDDDDSVSDYMRLVASVVHLRSLCVQVHEAMFGLSDNGEGLSSLQDTIDMILPNLSKLLTLATINIEDFIGNVFDGESSTQTTLKPSQIEVLKSLLREIDISFLERISLRQWKCFRGSNESQKSVSGGLSLSERSSSPYRLLKQTRIGSPTMSFPSISQTNDFIEVIAGDIHIIDGKIRASSHFPTFRVRDVSLQRMTGRWFYECTVITDGLMQIGYANTLFRCDPICGQGVGDHYHSWAYDGLRNKKWNVSCETYGRRWKAGDVIGVLMDMDLMELRYFINGEDMGPAFTNFNVNYDMYPAVSLNVRQSIRFNCGQEKFLYPPDEIDGKPYRPVKLAMLLKKSISKMKLLKGIGSSSNIAVNAIDKRQNRRESKGQALSDDGNNDSNVDTNRDNDIDEAVQNSSNRHMSSVSALSATLNIASNGRDGDESDGVDDSDDEDDDDDNDAGDDEMRWRHGGNDEQSGGTNLAVVGESLNALGDANNSAMQNYLEMCREKLIGNLIGMGFPLDWAFRAAEHSDATASEAAAIAWIIERMELEQNKAGDGDGRSSREGGNDDDDYDESDDVTGLEFLLPRNINGHDSSLVISDGTNIDGRGTMISNPARIDIGSDSMGNSNTNAGNLSAMMLGSPGSAVREEVSSLRQRVNGILQGLALQVESPKNGNQTNDSNAANKNGQSILPNYLSNAEANISRHNLSARETSLHSIFTSIIPIKHLSKHRHDKEKQDVLGQISDLEVQDLRPIVSCCQVALMMYYSRMIVAKVLILMSDSKYKRYQAVDKLLVSFCNGANPSQVNTLLRCLFRQFIASASISEHYFFCNHESDRPGIQPFVNHPTSRLLDSIQELSTRTLRSFSSNYAVDDSSAGYKAIQALSRFAITLLENSEKMAGSEMSSNSISFGLSVSCSVIFSVLVERSLSQLEQALSDQLQGNDGQSNTPANQLDQKNYILLSTISQGSGANLSPYYDREGSDLDDATSRRQPAPHHLIWSYILLKNMMSYMLHNIDSYPMNEFASLLIQSQENRNQQAKSQDKDRDMLSADIEDDVHPIYQLTSTKTFCRLLKIIVQAHNPSVQFFVYDLAADILSFVIAQLVRSKKSQDDFDEKKYSSLLHYAMDIFIFASSSREMYHSMTSRFKSENLIVRHVICSQTTQAMCRFITSIHLLGSVLDSMNHEETLISLERKVFPAEEIASLASLSRLTHRNIVQDWDKYIFSMKTNTEDLDDGFNINRDNDLFDMTRFPWYLRVTQVTAKSITVSWNIMSWTDDSAATNTINHKPSKWTLFLSRFSHRYQDVGYVEDIVPVAEDLQDIGTFRIEDLLPDTLFRVTLAKSVSEAIHVNDSESSIALSLARQSVEGTDSLSDGVRAQPSITISDESDNGWNILSIAKGRKGDEAIMSPPATLSIYASTETEPLFIFETEYIAPSLVINGPSQLSLRNTSNKKWSTARINIPMESGLHKWEVSIDRCISKNIFIGICTEEAKFDNYCGCDKYGWGFLANKAIWHNKTKLRNYGELFKTGDIVTVILDVDSETLSYQLNGLDLGPAVALDTAISSSDSPDTIGPFYPAFSLYNEDDQISILPPSRHQSYPSIDPEQNLKSGMINRYLNYYGDDDTIWTRTSMIESIINRLEILSQLLSLMTERNSFDYSSRMTMNMVADELQLRWERWSCPSDPCTLRSFLIGSEFICVLDSVQLCHHISLGKIGPGDHVVMDGKVSGQTLGAARHKIWVCYEQSCDNIVGYTQDSLLQMLSKGSLKVIASAKTSDRSKKHSDKSNPILWNRTARECRAMDQSDGPGCHSPSWSQSSREMVKAIQVSCQSWNKDKDHVLVQVLDGFTSVCNLSPFDINLDRFLDFLEVFSSQDKSSLSSSSSMAVKLYLDAIVSSSMTDICRNHSLEDICLRTMLLLHMNDIIQPLLPLIIPSSSRVSPDSVAVDSEKSNKFGRPQAFDIASNLSRAKHQLFSTVKSSFMMSMARVPWTIVSRGNQESQTAHSSPQNMFSSNAAASSMSPSFLYSSPKTFGSTVMSVDIPSMMQLPSMDETDDHGLQPSPSRQFIDENMVTESSEKSAQNNSFSLQSLSASRMALSDPTVDVQVSLPKETRKPQGNASDERNNNNDDDSVWVIEITPSETYHHHFLRQSGLLSDQTADISDAAWMTADFSNSWRLMDGIQSSLVGQIYRQLQKIQQNWLVRAVGIDIADESLSQGIGTQAADWDDAFRSMIMTNDNPFLIRALDCASTVPRSSPLFTVMSSMSLGPLKLSERYVYAFLVTEALQQVEGMLSDVARDCWTIDDSMGGVIDLLTQFMHMIGLVLGLAIASDISIELDIPQVFLRALSGSSADDGMPMSDNGSKTLLSNTCALCLRHGVTSVISDHALTLWSMDDWNKRLHGFTIGFGNLSPGKLQRSARYVGDIHDHDDHVLFFWAIIHQMPYHQIVLLLKRLHRAHDAADAASLDKHIKNGSVKITLLPSREEMPPFSLPEMLDIALVRIPEENYLENDLNVGIALPRYPSLQMMVAKFHHFLSNIHVHL